MPAYDLKLINRIEVDGTFDQPDFKKPYMEVQSAKVTKTTCRLAIDVDSRDVTSTQEV
ncbi:MAG: hypothetical protein RBS80_02215 [Thermoguttaceae bacterium]|nr:hypothetical protein [Thermoguttaceae bacterium]